MHLIPVPIVVNVHEKRALERAAQDGCDLAVAANRCAVSAMEAAGLESEPAQPAAPKAPAKKGKKA